MLSCRPACAIGRAGERGEGERASRQTIRLHRANPPHEYIRLPDPASTLLQPFSRDSTPPNGPADVQQHDGTRLTMVACPLFGRLPCRRWALEDCHCACLRPRQTRQYTASRVRARTKHRQTPGWLRGRAPPRSVSNCQCEFAACVPLPAALFILCARTTQMSMSSNTRSHFASFAAYVSSSRRPGYGLMHSAHLIPSCRPPLQTTPHMLRLPPRMRLEHGFPQEQHPHHSRPHHTSPAAYPPSTPRRQADWAQ